MGAGDEPSFSAIVRMSSLSSPAMSPSALDALGWNAGKRGKLPHGFVLSWAGLFRKDLAQETEQRAGESPLLPSVAHSSAVLDVL